MECGHQANGERDGKPVCVICIGLDPGAEVARAELVDLSGRVAVCPDCGQRKPSNTHGLPFFQHRPDRDTDSFYDGCKGWD